MAHANETTPLIVKVKNHNNFQQSKYYWIGQILFSGVISIAFFILWILSGYHIVLTDIYDWINLLVIAAAIIVLILFLIVTNKMPEKTDPIRIPKIAFICAGGIALFSSAGYYYLSVFKWIFAACDLSQEEWETPNSPLYHLLRIFMAISFLVYLYYIKRRDYVGLLHTNFDTFTRCFIDFTLLISGFRFLLLKSVSLIRPYCIETDLNTSILFIKALCPPNTFQNFTCNISALNPEMRSWFYIHSGLLKPLIITGVSELIPVILVAHALACRHGNDEQRNKKLQSNGKKEEDRAKHQSTQELTITRPYNLAVNILILLPAFIGILTWTSYLDSYISGSERGIWTAGLQLIAVGLKFVIVALYYQFVLKKVPTSQSHDESDESLGDLWIIFVSFWLIVVCVIFAIHEIAILMVSYEDEFNPLLVMISLPINFIALLCKWFEYKCLEKCLAFKEEYLPRIKFLPIFAFSLLAWNFAEFGRWFFYVQIEKHGLKHEIESIHGTIQNLFVFIVLVRMFLTFAGYLYAFSCGLCWTDLILRFESPSGEDLKTAEKV